MILNVDFIQLNEYNGLPHFLIPIVTDTKKSIGAINWIIQEMTNRYSLITQFETKNIPQYNEICESKLQAKLPRILFLIDEIEVLLNENFKEVESALCTLLLRGNNVGIHTVIATRNNIKYMNIGKIRGCISNSDENYVKDIINNLKEKSLTTHYNNSENLTLEDELNKIDFKMDGFEFEKYSKQLLRNNGFDRIDVTKSSGDYRADVIAYKDDIKYAIQCKKYSQPVGISAIQEVIASKTIYKCHVAVVLTNNTFTNSAIELAKVNNVLLWDRKKLQGMITK